MNNIARIFKKTVGLFLLTTCYLLLTTHSYAQELEVTCSDTSCSASTSTAIFTTDIIWFPGRTLSKPVRIRNTATKVQTIGVKTQNITISDILSEVFSISIWKIGESSVIWTGSLKDFLKVEISLSAFEPSSEQDFAFEVKMDKSADNNYQNKKMSFDLVFGTVQESINPTATPIPTPTPTPTTTKKPSSTPTISILTSQTNKLIMAATPTLQSGKKTTGQTKGAKTKIEVKSNNLKKIVLIILVIVLPISLIYLFRKNSES